MPTFQGHCLIARLKTQNPDLYKLLGIEASRFLRLFLRKFKCADQILENGPFNLLNYHSAFLIIFLPIRITQVSIEVSFPLIYLLFIHAVSDKSYKGLIRVFSFFHYIYIHFYQLKIL